MLKEHFISELYFIYAVWFPKKHFRDKTKGNWLTYMLLACLFLAY